MQNKLIQRHKCNILIPLKRKTNPLILPIIKVHKKNDKLHSFLQSVPRKLSRFQLPIRTGNKTPQPHLHHACIWFRMVCVYDCFCHHWSHIQFREFGVMVIPFLCFWEGEEIISNCDIFAGYFSNWEGNVNCFGFLSDLAV